MKLLALSFQLSALSLPLPASRFPVDADCSKKPLGAALVVRAAHSRDRGVGPEPERCPGQEREAGSGKREAGR